MGDLQSITLEFEEEGKKETGICIHMRHPGHMIHMLHMQSGPRCGELRQLS